MSKRSSSKSGSRLKSNDFHIPKSTFTFEKLAKSKVILDITTLAFFIEFSAQEDPTINVYDVLKKSKSFNAFYKVLNRITQGLNKTKFSYFFLSMVLYFSTDKSYSFKEFDLMFPNLGFSENEENIGKMLHNISKQVITELSKSNSPKKRTSSRLSSLRKEKSKINRFSSKQQNGGNYKNRFKRRTMKYKQTGGDMWTALFILCCNSAVGIRFGPRIMMLLFIMQIVIGGMSIHGSLTSLFNFGRNGEAQGDLIPAITEMAERAAARFRNSVATVPNAVALFNESPPMALFQEALRRLPLQFDQYRSSQPYQIDRGFSFGDIIAILSGDVNIVLGDMGRLNNLLDGFLRSDGYRQLFHLVQNGADAVGGAVRAAAASSQPLYDVPTVSEDDGYIAMVLNSIRSFLPRIGNAQREIDAFRYNAAHAGDIYETAVRALGEQGLITATRMAQDIQRLVHNACTAYHTQVSVNIMALTNGIWQFLMGIFGFMACVTFMRQNGNDNDNPQIEDDPNRG